MSGINDKCLTSILFFTPETNLKKGSLSFRDTHESILLMGGIRACLGFASEKIGHELVSVETS